MPAWVSDPTSWLRKGALWGAFCVAALPALADPDLSGLWQMIENDFSDCGDGAVTFSDSDGVLTYRTPLDVFGMGAFGWRHGAWKDGRLDLASRLPGFATPMWLEEVSGGLDLCKDAVGRVSCAQFRRCPAQPSS